MLISDSQDSSGKVVFFFVFFFFNQRVLIFFLFLHEKLCSVYSLGMLLFRACFIREIRKMCGYSYLKL